MSTTSKTAGSCKKCKRDCPEKKNASKKSNGGLTWNVGPLSWINGYGPDEPVSEEPFVDSNATIDDVNSLVDYLKLTCLNVGSSELFRIKQEMHRTLTKKIYELEQSGSLKPPPEGQCQYVKMSNIEVKVQTTNCEDPSGRPLPPKIDVETEFDIEIGTKPCS
jgi:hypothetical protein